MGMGQDRASRPASRLKRIWGQPAQKISVGLACVAGIVAEPHNPIQVPGHRALMWLTLLLVARLACGPGWSTLVGLSAAAGSLALVGSPHGVWTVAQYGLAGVGIDVLLTAFPGLARTPLRLLAFGAGVELAVGWIAPLGQSVFAGVGPTEIWQSLQSVGWTAALRLFALDAAFGAGAGLIGWTLVYALFRHRPSRSAVRAGMIGATA